MNTPDMHRETESFTGNELDESWDEPVMVQDKTGVDSTAGDGFAQVLRKVPPRRAMALIALAAGLCLATVIYGIVPDLFWRQQIRSPRVYRFTISQMWKSLPEAPPLQFDSFIIPLKRSKTHSYLSVSLSLCFQEETLRRAIIEQEYAVRGIIFETLMKETNRSDTIPSLKTIKAAIVRVVNGRFTAGRISGVYITGYLAV